MPVTQWSPYPPLPIQCKRFAVFKILSFFFCVIFFFFLQTCLLLPWVNAT
eukprot:NODE_3925_length_339_cov_27.765517_g3843_i0.p4 GENE.NODE_3925_length_339_cov_27.765517_g3843_i0~~NODE_3925_length_339_cov_27.765517_g3843_i0.p4  ORF type:complete len:50 (+),score=16.53 NODE_3925_length_339_cov_27.765517_g3843_i0:70-219(+)